ncbi:holin, partial [Collinsella aerofaciens]|nr:holin [Collinsella aerofaciens]
TSASVSNVTDISADVKVDDKTE